MLSARAIRSPAIRHGPYNKSLRSIRHFATQDITSPLQIQKLSGSLGAVINNIDLQTLSSNNSSTIHTLRETFLQHKVLFFRNTNNTPLTPSQFLSFASLFGKPIEYPFVSGIDGFPNIIRVLKRESETINFGGIWHSDTVYLPEPPSATILLAEQVPPCGGDTLFANQVAAYAALSDGLKRTLSNLVGVHTSAKADTSKTREDRVKDSGQKSQPENLISRHPVVRTHPETGEKVLYINTAHTERFEGWTVEESAPLLKYLHQHQIRPEFTCRFRWEVGSIAMWDNRAVLHNPINDYHGHRRSMLRITLAGDKPV